MKTILYNLISQSLLITFLLITMGNRPAVPKTVSGRQGFTSAKQAVSASVKVQTYYEDKEGDGVALKGAGALISPKGLIITNYHNINEAQTIEVTLYNGMRLPACLLEYNDQWDLALLQVDAEELPYLRLGSSKSIDIGDHVYAVGNPRHLDFTLTSGIVSAFDRKLDVINHPKPVEQFIQTDVTINYGCSGGPLLNAEGQLVGVNTAISTKSGHFEGYSFAQPVEMIKALLSEEHWLEIIRAEKAIH